MWKFHPATKLVIAFSFIISIFGLPLQFQTVIIILGLILVWMVRPLPSQDPGFIFFRIWLIAGFFLFVIHCLSWNGELIFIREGLMFAEKGFFRIGSLILAFLWLIRTVKPEELYAMLIDLRISIKIIYVLFQAIYLIPRFGEKAKDIFLAQQARGFIMKGVKNRLKAYILILAPLFSIMVYEIEENAAALSAKGFNASGQKTHLTEIRFKTIDQILTTASLFISFILIFSYNS